MLTMRLALLIALLAALAAAQPRYAPPERPEWNEPVEPFRVAGNIYYVGAANVSSYLIATDAGHILIETGFRETVPLIKANFGKLGFRFQDVRILLASHAHYDHSGGLADVKAATGARLLVSAIEAPAFSRGGTSDFAFGDKYPFPPVDADSLLRDGEVVRLGGVSLTAHLTPGHTKGCLSFSTEVSEGSQTYRVVFPCSLTAPGYRLIGNRGYPNIVQDFEQTFAKLRSLQCDVFFPHHRRLSPGLTPGAADYSQYIDAAETALRQQLTTARKPE